VQHQVCSTLWAEGRASAIYPNNAEMERRRVTMLFGERFSRFLRITLIPEAIPLRADEMIR